MIPNLVFNGWAMLSAGVAAFVFGSLYYGPLLGKRSARVMTRALALQILGTALTVFVMAHIHQVWRPSVWDAGTDGPGYFYGFFAGVLAWVGFSLPIQANKVGWEGRSWSLFFINVIHDLIALQLISQILANWRS